MKQKMNLPKKRVLLALGALIMIIVLLSVAGGMAKYKTQSAVANKVSYTNTLAESFKLLDHPMKQLDDGSYEVDNTADAQPTDGYSFKLIPGITIPASPYIEITGKTSIPAYLYLEIDRDANVELSIDSAWTLLSSTAGKNGGAVYVYQDGTALTGDGGDSTETYATFTVEPLSSYPAELGEGEIKVYAYLLQKVGDQSAEATFTDAPQP